MAATATTHKDEPLPTLNEFEIGRLLGQGSFSQVFLATRYFDKSQYAIKVVEKKRVTRNEMYLYILQEKKVMLMMDHPNLVKLHWTFKDPMCVYLMMDYSEGGELFDLLHKAPDKKIPLALARHYTAEMVNALEYMHSLGIVHRDFKPENVLLSKTGHIKVADFGTSKIFGQDNPNDLSNSWKAKIKPDADVQEERRKMYEEAKEKKAQAQGPQKQDKEERRRLRQAKIKKRAEKKRAQKEKRRQEAIARGEEFEEESSESEPDFSSDDDIDPFKERKRYSFVGTAEYMPPEVLHNQMDKKGIEIDLWALGCILFQMLVGHVPFKGKSDYLTMKLTLKRKINWGEGCQIDAKAKDLIENLLQLEPWDRLGSERLGGYATLKAHPFFEGIDFENIHTIDPPKHDVKEGPADYWVFGKSDVVVIDDLSAEFAALDHDDEAKELERVDAIFKDSDIVKVADGPGVPTPGAASMMDQLD